MARKVLMADVCSCGYRVDQGLNGWREDGLGQQRHDGGGCATMRERWEGVESPGAYVDD